MRTKSTGGFTLIELLIVIAIIGILAAVLIPNLLNARASANERAAQAYGRNIVTAATATLASDITLNPSHVAMANCEDGYNPSEVANAGYSVGNPGAAVTQCSVTGAADDSDFVVTINNVQVYPISAGTSGD